MLASDWQVLVTWEQRYDGWRLCADKPINFADPAKAKGRYLEELNNNGHLDPGREDIREVMVELRYKGQRVDRTEGPCSPGRNQYWLGEVRKVAASCTGPLANALKAKL